MFHYVTGIPFQSDLHGGAYDDLTLWEQIDQGAHYTPAKKWLFIVPIILCVPSNTTREFIAQKFFTGSLHQPTTRIITRGCLLLTCRR